MERLVLITGGAGFIGSHLADELLANGYRVRALDVLCQQVHGPARCRPAYLDDRVELIVGDVRDPCAMASALDGVEAVFHFAAAVGVGQSMYEISHYVDVNSVGAAVLLEEIIRRPARPRLIVASSMSIYGEGLYVGADGHMVANAARLGEHLAAGRWEVCDRSGRALSPLPTDETKPPNIASVYALTKYDQERLCLTVGAAYGMPTVALRFFNVYGPRQALSNPYTGVLAIFAARLMNDSRPEIFEDGFQQRDFVNVRDVARACRLAMESPAADGMAINVGSGRPVSVRDIASELARRLGKPHLTAEITRKYRAGDIRHCFADISLARQVLGYQPQVTLEAGLAELVEWLGGQVAVDRFAQARAELRQQGLAP